MKYLLGIVGLLIFLFTTAFAETDPEMERLQRQLNCQNFGNCGDEPPKQKAPAPAPAPKPVAIKAKPTVVEPVSTGRFSLSSYAEYKLNGAIIGMLAADVLAGFRAAGYQCNTGPAAGMKAMFPGHHVCLFISLSSPRILHFAVNGDRVSEIEYMENYQGGFPAGYLDDEKAAFKARYPGKVKCKGNTRGGRCDMLGQGFRISMTAREAGNSASLTYRVVSRR